MRALTVMVVAAALLVFAYYFYLHKLPTTDQGTAPTQAISLTGVRADLLQIAQAERASVASNGNCVTLAELQSSSALAMTRAERDGYVYSVECSGGDFNVVGRHAAAPAGSSIRYPNLAVDQNMQVHEVN
jgi:multidrug resistance efflux pump